MPDSRERLNLSQLHSGYSTAITMPARYVSIFGKVPQSRPQLKPKGIYRWFAATGGCKYMETG